MVTEGGYLRSLDKEKIWQRYCGFFDFSLREFMEIQKTLLLEQLELVAQNPLHKELLKGIKPKTIEEFRKLVPLTTYEDYAPYIDNCREDFLAEKPCCWGRTSARGGSPKWVPYTQRAIDWLGKVSITTLILACTSKKGEVNIDDGIRVMQNVPPRPYFTGIGAWVLTQQMDIRMIPPTDKYENQPFEKKIEDGFKMALHTGVDILGSLTTILIKMGERFTESSKGLKISRNMLHPQTMLRLIQAFLRSKREKRGILPKDLWPLKGLLCYGMDTSIYKQQIIHYWGKEPLELYGSTEAGLIAIQAWNKKWLTFSPFSVFLEFVPEEEWLKNREDNSYQPSTVLLDEVEPGKLYEIIITNLHGMPFLRYRVGDLIRIASLEDKEAGIKLPQMVFESRADGLIDIGGFTRLDEKTIWQAIANTGIRHEDWAARKEVHLDKPILRIYIEPKESIETKELEYRIHEQLKAIDKDYKDLENILGVQPIHVTTLPKGSFMHYLEEKRKAGAELAHFKPPHMNASDRDIKMLLYLASSQQG